MAKAVVCPDGSVVRGETDDELVAGVEAWLLRAQPRLAGSLSRAEILARAVDVAADPSSDVRDHVGRKA